MSDCCSGESVKPEPVASCCSGSSVKPPEPVETGGCCSAEPGVTADEKALTRTWLKLGISLVIAGQSTALGLGMNTLVEDPLTMTDAAYWGVHGLLIASSLVVMVLLGRSLLKALGESFAQYRLSVEALFFLSVIGAFVGSLVATFTGTGDIYYEVVAITLCIYTIGKTLSMRSRARALQEVAKLRDDFDEAYIVNASGDRERVALSSLKSGDFVSVAAGEAIAVDGIIESGEGFIQEIAMTGEPAPVSRKVGEPVLAGTHSVDGHFSIRVEKGQGERGLDAVLDTVAAARMRPSRLQAQADRLVQWFVPFVTAVSLLTFIFWALRAEWWEALFNSMAVLLVACPCALGLATPIAVWTGLQRLSRLGVVARTGDFLDVLAHSKSMVFDKTGTLSEAELQVEGFVFCGDTVSEAELLSWVYAVESTQSHPIARAITQYCEPRGTGASGVKVEIEVVPGQGVRAIFKQAAEESVVLIGSLSLMPEQAQAQFAALAEGGTSGKMTIYLCHQDQAVGQFILNEHLRAGTDRVFEELNDLGVRSVILTGDPKPQWESIGGVTVESGLSPADKCSRVKDLQVEEGEVVFIGDGINDAGAMAESAASIAMGEGAALAKSTSAAVIMGNTLQALPDAVRISRHIFQAVRGNLLFAIVYNVIGMGLAAAGVLHPVLAALIMLVSSLLVSVRAIRSASVDSKSGA